MKEDSAAVAALHAVAVATPASPRPGRCTLRMERLELDVRLGCTPEERREPQKVELDATLEYAAPPAACRTDRLGDTVCYAELASLARATAVSRAFDLVEHLGHELYTAMRRRVPPDVRLTLAIRKVAPPIARLHGGVTFTIEEHPS